MDAPDLLNGRQAVPPADPRPQRTRGAASVAARREAGRTRIASLRQEGSLRLLFPRPAGEALEAVALNTSGGLTGGDRLRLDARAGPGARLTLTTQACERAYRAAGGHAQVETRLGAEDGARLDWLPQETILFEGSRLRRGLRLDMEPTATALLVEPVVFGRLARGEALRDAAFRDRWEVRVGGRLRFADALRLEGDVHALLDRLATGGGARALATILLAGPGAEARLREVRELSDGAASLVGEGLLVARLLAPDGLALRRRLLPLILLLAGTIPKVWTL